MTRRRLKVDERRAQLLELGLTLFADRPYEDISIEEIAAAAGISKGLLYHYFGGKRELYLAGMRLAGERLIAALEAIEVDDPDERIVAGLNAYLDYVEERAGAYTSLIHGGIGVDDQTLAIVDGVRAQIVARILADLGLETSSPLFRLAIRSWIGAVEAACLDWLEHRDLDRDQMVTLLHSSLLIHVQTADNLG